MLSMFLNCSLRNNICSSRWFINLSDISLVEFLQTCSLGLCLTHHWKNSFLKLLTSVKNKLFIFLNSSKICSQRFPTSSIKTCFSWFSSFSLNFWFSFAIPISLMTSSTESRKHLKTSYFPHFLFPLFSVWVEAIINISSYLSSTVGYWSLMLQEKWSLMKHVDFCMMLSF